MASFLKVRWIPAFHTPEAQDCIRRLGLRAEIVVSDNGSTDGSPRIAVQMGGNRFWGGIAPGAMSLSHRFGVRLLSALARFRFHVSVGDFHCGLRAFERKRVLALKLKCPGMEFAKELIARFARSGAKIAEIPTPLRRDLRGGSSHLRTVRDGLRHLYYILFDKPFCR